MRRATRVLRFLVAYSAGLVAAGSRLLFLIEVSAGLRPFWRVVGRWRLRLRFAGTPA